jgi:hypothetical protein
MSVSSALFKVGAWLLLLYGVGHVLGYFYGRAEKHDRVIIQSMKQALHHLPGVTRTVFHLHEGYSLVMSLMLMAFGALDLTLAHVVPGSVTASIDILVLNIAVAVLNLAIAIRYFFIGPVLLAGLSAAAFLVALFVR